MYSDRCFISSEVSSSYMESQKSIGEDCNGNIVSSKLPQLRKVEESAECSQEDNKEGR